jgi:hypothetical protein
MQEVRADIPDDAVATPFIQSATLLVNRIALTGKCTDEEMIEIETWLAAHFYSIYEQATANEKAGPTSESKQHYVDAGFATTMWGTQAMLLDVSGTLAAINKKAKGGNAAGPTSKVGLTYLGGKA